MYVQQCENKWLYDTERQRFKLATLPSSTHFHASVLIIYINKVLAFMYTHTYNTYTLQLVLFPLGVTQLLQFPN